MAPTADNLSDSNKPKPDPQKSDLSTALGAAAEAGKQEYDEGADAQGDIAADDAGGSKLAQEFNREHSLPKPPPGGASS